MDHSLFAYLQRQPTHILLKTLNSSLSSDPWKCNYNTAMLILQILEERSVADGSMQTIMEKNAALLWELAERYESYFQ